MQLPEVRVECDCNNSQLVDDMAKRLYAAGRIKDLCQNAGFYERLTLIEEQFPSCSVLLHKMGILPPAVQRLIFLDVCFDFNFQDCGPKIDSCLLQHRFSDPRLLATPCGIFVARSFSLASSL